MKQFAAVDDQYDPHSVEARVFEYWDQVDAYERTKAHRADGEDFFFVDGPPYTSGAAHMGTTWNKTLKDAYIRYLRMQGYNVFDRPGYDMHGLPIETKVEERLGFENKKDIEEFGIEAFIEECKEFAEEQLDGLQEDFISFGVWMDWDDPYKTVSPEYMEAAWWGFKQAHERELVEKGKRSISQCPRCETAIAKNEVEYHQVEDPSIYVAFPLVEREGSLVIWTTTPWTIPGNTFVAVDESFTYSAVRVTDGSESEVYYIEESLVDDVMSEAGYESFDVIDSVHGEDMIGWEYEHPLAEEVPEHPAYDGALQVYHADYVEADRTGLVHSAPGHGEVDFERGEELGLEPFCPVGSDGVFDTGAGEYAGEFVRDANETIIQDLDRHGLLLAAGTVVHDYGQCWRCDTDIIQIVTDQWFITVTDIKDELLANIEESEWYPAWARDNRFRDFVEDAPDWNVSRQRYWGIPIPIWTPEGASAEEEADDMIVIGSREELASEVDQSVDPRDIDLHKPTVDSLSITRDGVTYTRVPDVFDVWLDSSVATWGTIDYPMEDGLFEEVWPADLILEAHDQTRGWFWSQLGMGSAAVGLIPYTTVLMHGHALDSDGRKMSKSLGNIVEPSEAISRFGRDVMRLFLLSANPQGEDMRFSWDGMEDMQRDLNIFWNVFRFPLPYMRMDDFRPTAVDLDEVSLAVEDRWVLSRLQTVKDAMTDAWESYRQDTALEALLEFIVEDVSRYYVQIVRERMWEEEASDSKTAAYATMYHVLQEVVVLLAPFAPFVSEEIYGHLTGDGGFETVHMEDWPSPTAAYRDLSLEEDISVVRAIEEAGSRARQQAGRKLRWPVSRVIVDTTDTAVQAAVESHESLLADRLNANEILVVPPDETWGELEYEAIPEMDVLGPAFGEKAGAINQAVSDVRFGEPDLRAVENELDAIVGGVELTDDMISFMEHPPADVTGTAFESGVVYVDTGLTDEIEAEGYAREVIRRIQEMRKELSLEMDELIRVEITVFDERVGELVSRREELIKDEVRAAAIEEVSDGLEKEWEIEGVLVQFTVEPLAEAPAE